MMKLKKIVLQPRLIALFVTPLLMCFTAQPSLAAPNQQSGEIKIEGQEQAMSPALIQTQTIEYFQNIAKDLNAGVIPAPTLLDLNKITYVNSVYLYCTISSGTCPLPLDALLEIDVMTSFRSGKAECPTLSRFWTNWLKNGYEKRQEYNMKTTYLSPSTDFSKKDRPKYIKCQETIQEIMSAGKGNQNWFKERFTGEGEGKTSLLRFNEFLALIKSKGVNVFAYSNLEQ